nr:hypothetical protein [Pseudonocardia sp. ICBG601]
MARNRSATWRGVSIGNRSRSSAAVPATSGAEYDVPRTTAPSGPDGRGRSWPGAARSTQGPGTEKSPGTSSPSTAPTARTES